MPSPYFSNFEFKQDTDYFLYIGEIKNYGLNQFLARSLSRIFNRNFECIAIVPDVFEQYNYDNIVVIVPDADPECRYETQPLCCRVPATEFMTAVSSDAYVLSLVDQILKQQDSLFVYLFESIQQMTLDRIPGVSILGPDKGLARKLNSKAIQLPALSSILPVVDFEICRGYDAMIQATDRLRETWINGIFVTKAYSAAGVNSIVASCKTDIQNKFLDQDDTYVVTRFMPHTHDPTVLGVVAGPTEVYIAGVADQRIEGGNRFTGSTYPSVLDAETVETLKYHTRNVGRWMGAAGYRGIFGCDYIVTEQGLIYFLEINARKQGTTLEFCCTLDQILPPGSPDLTELEYYAVVHGNFPPHTVEPPADLNTVIHWGTYNFKIHQDIRTGNYIPQNTCEQQAFEKIASSRLKKDFLILEHPGADVDVAAGSFLARVVALGHDHESVAQGIDQGRKTIELTVTRQNQRKENHADPTCV